MEDATSRKRQSNKIGLSGISGCGMLSDAGWSSRRPWARPSVSQGVDRVSNTAFRDVPGVVRRPTMTTSAPPLTTSVLAQKCAACQIPINISRSDCPWFLHRPKEGVWRGGPGGLPKGGGGGGVRGSNQSVSPPDFDQEKATSPEKEWRFLDFSRMAGCTWGSAGRAPMSPPCQACRDV